VLPDLEELRLDEVVHKLLASFNVVELQRS